MVSPLSGTPDPFRAGTLDFNPERVAGSGGVIEIDRIWDLKSKVPCPVPELPVTKLREEPV